jgi:hypothetical protein
VAVVIIAIVAILLWGYYRPRRINHEPTQPPAIPMNIFYIIGVIVVIVVVLRLLGLW